jgi:EAL and modified HD-GYP domain-containing signal transduction protein
VTSEWLTTLGSLALVALVPAMMEPTPDVMKGMKTLDASKVAIAIDEFDAPTGPGDPIHMLAGRARFVRLDASVLSGARLRTAAHAAKKLGLLVVADMVSDRAAYTACVQAGCDFFQGSHFSRPEPLPASSLPTSTVVALQVLALARDDTVQERELERVISSDPSVTYQLLRIVNSASTGGRGITSVGHALRLAGRSTLVRWLALATLASRADQSGIDGELTTRAVQRAYLAEELAKLSTGRDPQTAFLVGLFSLIDAVFRISMAELVERINLTAEVREVLLDRTGPYADLLTFIEAYELGLWESADAAARSMGVDPAVAGGLYVNAVTESNALVSIPT